MLPFVDPPPLHHGTEVTRSPLTSGSPRWPVRVAGLHSFVPPPPARTATAMLHLRSEPSSVALGEDDYAFVPPAAPSTGTDRFPTRSWRHIRPLIDTPLR